MAVSRRHPPLIDYLLKASADVHKAIGHDDDPGSRGGGPIFISWSNGLNPLMVAARNGMVEISCGFLPIRTSAVIIIQPSCCAN